MLKCVVVLTVQAPIIPLILHDGDTRNFDVYPDFNLHSLQPSSDDDVALFRDFWSVAIYSNKTIISRVLAGRGRGNPLNFGLSDIFLWKTFVQKINNLGLKSPILGLSRKLKGKLEIWSGNMQLTVWKLQLSTPSAFFNQRRHSCYSADDLVQHSLQGVSLSRYVSRRLLLFSRLLRLQIISVLSVAVWQKIRFLKIFLRLFHNKSCSVTQRFV